MTPLTVDGAVTILNRSWSMASEVKVESANVDSDGYTNCRTSWKARMPDGGWASLAANVRFRFDAEREEWVIA